jgi:hypothetical protein
MIKLILASVFILFCAFSASFAEEKTGDKHEKHDESEKHEDHEGHEKGDEHKDEKEHGHEEEENTAVGPDKGILEKSEHGFKLSPQAIKSFDLKTQNYLNPTAEFPRATLVEVKEEKFVYRLRDGWIKKVPVKVLGKHKLVVNLELSQFHAGDQIIVGGTGFVRVSELVVEEGVSEGHSH